jgi:hypothetical protein
LQRAGLSERTHEAPPRRAAVGGAYQDAARSAHGSSTPREYFLFFENDRQFASASLKIAFCGIKFFFRAARWGDPQEDSRPQAETLPDVLTTDEVRRLIEAVRTPHNRAYVWTGYSLGLQLGEACTCRWALSTASGCWCMCRIWDTVIAEIILFPAPPPASGRTRRLHRNELARFHYF